MKNEENFRKGFFRFIYVTLRSGWITVLLPTPASTRSSHEKSPEVAFTFESKIRPPIRYRRDRHHHSPMMPPKEKNGQFSNFSSLASLRNFPMCQVLAPLTWSIESRRFWLFRVAEALCDENLTEFSTKFHNFPLVFDFSLNFPFGIFSIYNLCKQFNLCTLNFTDLRIISLPRVVSLSN